MTPTTKSGRQWTWCSIWKCWHHDDYCYKIYPIYDKILAIDLGFSCSSHGVWHSGFFTTFEEAESELFKSGTVKVEVVI